MNYTNQRFTLENIGRNGIWAFHPKGEDTNFDLSQCFQGRNQLFEVSTAEYRINLRDGEKGGETFPEYAIIALSTSGNNGGTGPGADFIFDGILPHSAKISAANCAAGPRSCALTAQFGSGFEVEARRIEKVLRVWRQGRCLACRSCRPCEGNLRFSRDQEAFLVRTSCVSREKWK